MTRRHAKSFENADADPRSLKQETAFLPQSTEPAFPCLRSRLQRCRRSEGFSAQLFDSRQEDRLNDVAPALAELG